MSNNVFTIHEGSLTDQFLQSRAKVRIFGGGFGNSKTASSCMLALQLAKDYPGCNGLIARETVRKLNDTIRAEFYKWCPKGWIKQAPMNDKDSTTCTLTNGSRINFRYVQQQGKGSGEHTSNLLSATYDWAIVDQAEDPGIEHKDFMDIFGRLRGDTPYMGDDDSMPRSGPRWLILTVNPSRNWVYYKLVRPLHVFNSTGECTKDLLVKKDELGEPILDEQGKAQPIIELYEGSTYTNKENLPPDFISTLESAYEGSMRKRFLLGEWGAFEGLVYPAYTDEDHQLPRALILEYFQRMRQNGVRIKHLEAFDWGLAAPSCYGLHLVDPMGNVFLIDGFYEKELKTNQICHRIHKLRDQYKVSEDSVIWCDPQIFKRTGLSGATIGPSTAQSIMDTYDGKLILQRGNNDIMNGILKCSGYLHVDEGLLHPIYRTKGSPRYFVAADIEWFGREITSYRWRISPNSSEYEDKPIDVNDHAMDMMKYALSKQPEASELPRHMIAGKPKYLMWTEDRERDEYSSTEDGRHGRAA